MVKLFISFILLIFLSASAIGQLPYVVAYEDIKEELKEIWHDKQSNKTYLVTVDRLCILEPGDLKCRDLGIAKNMLFHNQTYDRFNSHPIFLGNYGGFYEIKDETIKAYGISEKHPNAAIYKDGENLWVADYKIFKYSKEGVDTIPVIMNSEIPFWDIRKQSNGDLWFVNYASGAYKIDNENNKLRRISKLNGLPTNNLTSIHINSLDEIYVGYNGGIARIHNERKIETFDLKNYVLNDPIKEIESDNLGNLWFITDKKIGRLNINTKEVSIIPTNQSDDFVIHTLEYNSNKDIMLIGTSVGLYISSTQGVYFHGEDLYAHGPLYYFGDELLLSGKNKVQKFNLSNGDFGSSDFRPIQQAFPTRSGDFWITDRKDILLLDKKAQEVSKKIRKPVSTFNQITEIEGEVYLCHDKGIHISKDGKTQVLIKGDEAFYNVLSCYDRRYAVSEQGIYLIADGELHHQSEIDGKEKMLKSNKQFFIDDESLLIPSQRSIMKVKCTEKEIDFEYFPSLEDILDFHVQDENIYILHSDRLMMYKKEEYLKDPYNAYCTVPVNADEASKLFVDDQNKIWLQNKMGLAYIKKDHDKICNILKSNNFGEELAETTETQAAITNETSFFESIKKLSWPILACLILIPLLLLSYFLFKRSEEAI